MDEQKQYNLLEPIYSSVPIHEVPGAMDDRDGWWESVWEIRAGGATW